MAREAFLINPARKITGEKPKRKANKGRVGNRAPSRARRNPVGEEILIVGGNPVNISKKPVSISKKREIKASGTRTKTMTNNPKKGKAAKGPQDRKSGSVGGKRPYCRRNPEPSGGGISLSRPKTLIMPLAIGIGAKMVAEKAPGMLKLTGNSALAVQAGIALGGGLLLKKTLGNVGASVWFAVAGAIAVTGLLDKVLGTTLSGFGDDIVYLPAEPDYQENYLPEDSSLEEFPLAGFNGIGAFPEMY